MLSFFLHFWKTLNHSWHLPLTLGTWVYVSVLVCVRNDLYVKLLNKTNICGEHEGSQEPVIQHVNVYNYALCLCLCTCTSAALCPWLHTFCACMYASVSACVCMFRHLCIWYSHQPSWNTYGKAGRRCFPQRLLTRLLPPQRHSIVWGCLSVHLLLGGSLWAHSNKVRCVCAFMFLPS